MNQSVVQATLRAATQMAASGNYSAASTLLDVVEPSEITVEVHLLRAKIAAQQGRYEEAIAYWREVLSMVSDNQEAKQGIEVAEELRSRRGGRFYLRANLYYAILFLMIVGLVALLILVASRNTGRSDSASIKAIRDAQEQQLLLQRQIGESLKAISSPGGQDRAESLAGIKIAVPGISVHHDGNELLLLFEEGLFVGGGSEIRGEEQDTLSSLASQLEPLIGRISVTVSGHTDNVAMPAGRRHRDNFALALARAVAVVEFLRTKAQLPASMFTVRGLGEFRTPYSNDSLEGRARNRTVAIRISKVRE